MAATIAVTMYSVPTDARASAGEYLLCSLACVFVGLSNPNFPLATTQVLGFPRSLDRGLTTAVA